MSSKIMYRSCGSSIRTLINRHLRPTAAATNIQTETPVNIYNWRYLLPHSFVPQPVNIGRDAAAYSVLREVIRGRGKLEAAKRKFDDDFDVGDGFDYDPKGDDSDDFSMGSGDDDDFK